MKRCVQVTIPTGGSTEAKKFETWYEDRFINFTDFLVWLCDTIDAEPTEVAAGGEQLTFVLDDWQLRVLRKIRDKTGLQMEEACHAVDSIG